MATIEEPKALQSLSDTGYVKFIRKEVAQEPKSIVIVHVADGPKHEEVVNSFGQFLYHHRDSQTEVDVFNLNESKSNDEIEKSILKIAQADRIIIIASAKLTELFSNRERGGDNEFTDIVIEIILHILKEYKTPGHARLFAVYFDYSSKEELPQEILRQVNRVDELSTVTPSTLETFYGRLLRRKGKVSFPQLLDVKTGPGKKLHKSIRNVKRQRGLCEIIQHGENMSLGSEGDFGLKCLDLFRQDGFISHEEYQRVQRASTLSKKLDLLIGCITNKNRGIPDFLQRLLQVWRENVSRDKQKKSLVDNRIELIKDLRFTYQTVLDYLQQRDVISTAVVTAIRHERTGDDAVRKLLDELPNTRVAVTTFREALAVSHGHLADLVDTDSSDDSDDPDVYDEKQGGNVKYPLQDDNVDSEENLIAMGIESMNTS
ncbi:uncharacterized protein LOC144453423 isoform X1 [Glandiceps talaboti]